jgi:hypothetical protein
VRKWSEHRWSIYGSGQAEMNTQACVSVGSLSLLNDVEALRLVSSIGLGTKLICTYDKNKDYALIIERRIRLVQKNGQEDFSLELNSLCVT